MLSFGDNCYGQLGRTIGIDGTPRGIIPIKHKVTSISAGLGHSLAIANNPLQDGNYAYSWGWNSASQLGRRSLGNEPFIIPGLEGKDLLAIDGGRVHSLAVTTEGELWTWGSGKNGRLGLGSFADEEEPCLVESIQHEVHQAVCGMDHTVLLVNQ